MKKYYDFPIQLRDTQRTNKEGKKENKNHVNASSPSQKQ
jgi:hypothetical protein